MTTSSDALAQSSSETGKKLGPLSNLVNLKRGGIHISGTTSAFLGDESADLQCHVEILDKQVMKLALQQGVLGICEAYIQGMWTCDDLTTLMRILARNRSALDAMNSGMISRLSQWFFRVWYWRRQNSVDGSKQNIAEHYDLSSDLFRLFLDENLMYSSAIFVDEYESVSESLETASNRKLQTICETLDLQADDHVVEIGTGWGGFAIYAAKHFGCQVTTTTISKEQYQTAIERVEAEGLSDKVTLLLKDYRHLSGSYDKLVSIEMIEAVGHQYLDEYFSTCAHLLKPEGEALIQAITVEDTRYEKALKTVDYIKRYIFPGSFIPCNRVMISSAADAGLKLHSFRDIGQSYATTIKIWRERFNANLAEVRELGFDERFIRMWNLYFSYCEGGFKENVISDVHLHFKKNMPAKNPNKSAQSGNHS